MLTLRIVDAVVAAASGAALEIAELRNQDGGDREAAPSENGARGRCYRAASVAQDGDECDFKPVKPNKTFFVDFDLA